MSRRRTRAKARDYLLSRCRNKGLQGNASGHRAGGPTAVAACRLREVFLRGSNNQASSFRLEVLKFLPKSRQLAAQTLNVGSH